MSDGAEKRDGGVDIKTKRFYAAFSFWRRRWSRSSAIESLTPLPLGSETQGLPPVPMMKTLVMRVENSRSRGSRILTVCPTK